MNEALIPSYTEFLNEGTDVLSKEMGGNNDSEFLYITWRMSLKEIDDLLQKSEQDFKWLKANSKGTLGLFNRKDAQWVKIRIKFLKEIKKSKKKDLNYIPPAYKEKK